MICTYPETNIAPEHRPPQKEHEVVSEPSIFLGASCSFLLSGYNISTTYLCNELLGGGFKYFLFSPLFGEMIPIDEHIFQMGGSTTNIFMQHLITMNFPHLVIHGFESWKRMDLRPQNMSERTFTIAVVPWKKWFESKTPSGNGTCFYRWWKMPQEQLKALMKWLILVVVLANLLRIIHNAIATVHVTLPLGRPFSYCENWSHSWDFLLQ